MPLRSITVRFRLNDLLISNAELASQLGITSAVVRDGRFYQFFIGCTYVAFCRTDAMNVLHVFRTETELLDRVRKIATELTEGLGH